MQRKRLLNSPQCEIIVSQENIYYIFILVYSFVWNVCVCVYYCCYAICFVCVCLVFFFHFFWFALLFLWFKLTVHGISRWRISKLRERRRMNERSTNEKERNKERERKRQRQRKNVECEREIGARNNRMEVNTVCMSSNLTKPTWLFLHLLQSPSLSYSYNNNNKIPLLVNNLLRTFTRSVFNENVFNRWIARKRPQLKTLFKWIHNFSVHLLYYKWLFSFV